MLISRDANEMAIQHGNEMEIDPVILTDPMSVDSSTARAPMPESMDRSTLTSTTNKPSLLTLPRELRNKILNILFDDPEAPNFEAKPATTRYKNYFAIAAVNRQLNAEAKEELPKARTLIIFTTNGGSCIIDGLVESAIPIISTHGARKASEFSVMRIHVRFPGVGPYQPVPNKVTSTAIMISSSLPDLSRYLRTQSLHLPHAPDLSPPGEERCFPRMSITIGFNTTLQLPATKQRQLLRRLVRINRIGKVIVTGTTDDTVAPVLPGHSENFEAGPEITNVVERELFALKGFKDARKQDGHDYIRLADWRHALASKAKAAGNPAMAYVRYESAVRLSRVAANVNPYVMERYHNIRHKLVNRILKGQIGLSISLIDMGDWVKASMMVDKNLNSWDISLQNVMHDESIDILKGLQEKCASHIDANPDLKAEKDRLVAKEKEKHSRCGCCCVAINQDAGHQDDAWEDIDESALASMVQGVATSLLHGAYSL